MLFLSSTVSLWKGTIVADNTNRTFLYELGSLISDRISGIEGILIARTQWLYGCNRYVMQPSVSTDGKPADTLHLDEGQVRYLSPPSSELFGDASDPGGPQNEDDNIVRRR